MLHAMHRAHILPPLLVQLVELLIKDTLLLKVVVRLVQIQRRPRVLDRIVRVRLDVLAEHKPREEAQRQPPLPRFQEVQIDRIDHLLRRHKDI